MKCYVCAKEGKDSDAVAACIACGMGTCMKHTIRSGSWDLCPDCNAAYGTVNNGIVIHPLHSRRCRDAPVSLFRAGAAAMTLMLAAGTKPAAAFNIGIGQLWRACRLVCHRHVICHHHRRWDLCTRAGIRLPISTRQ